MKKIVYSLIVVVIIIAAVVLVGDEKDKNLAIGVISSETGEFGAIGQSFSQGVKFAFEEYKSKNPSSKVSLTIEDDGSESKKALSAYNKLTSLNKVDALINLSSPSINIIYDSVTARKLPVIQLGEQDVIPTDDTVYQVYPTQEAPQIATGEFARKISGGNNTVLFYTNDSTVIKFSNYIKTGYGKSFTEEFKLDQNQKEYATIVAKAMSHNPKFVVLSVYSSSGARIIQEMLKYPNRPTIIFDLIYDSTEYANALGDLSVLDGSYAMSLKSDLNADFVQKYKAKYGTDPSVFVAYGYDAFNTLVQNYDQNPDKMNANMEHVEMNGATGKITFNDLGLRQPEFAIKMLDNGKLVDIK